MPSPEETLLPEGDINEELKPEQGSDTVCHSSITLKPNSKSAGEEFLNVDADENWTVIDMGDILIHLMTPEYRKKYNLELFLKRT